MAIKVQNECSEGLLFPSLSGSFGQATEMKLGRNPARLRKVDFCVD